MSARTAIVAGRPQETMVTADGVAFDPNADVWRMSGISRSQNIFLHRLGTVMTPSLLASARQALAVSAVDVVSSVLFGWYDELYQVFVGRRSGAVDRIDLALVLEWRAEAKRSRTFRERLQHLRSFFKRWHSLGLPGVDDDAAAALAATRIQARPIGTAVRTADPNKGPFSDIEMQGIVAALRKGHAEGLVDTEDHALVWLFMALGVRASQLAAMKATDFLPTFGTDGSRFFLIRVPRAKQREIGPRGAFKTRTLVTEVGEAVSVHVEEQHRAWKDHATPFDIPMFGQPGVCKAENGSLPLHPNSLFIRNHLETAVGRLDVRSERTGDRLKITSRRFRYTVGSRLAADGASPATIAEALDHSSTRSVLYYVDTVPAILERIDKAVAFALAPLAQAFLGKLVVGEDQAKRGIDPASRIYTDGNRTVGSCGHYGFCGELAPLACYTCRCFQPWLNGSHEEVLGSLIADRKRVFEDTGDAAVAAANDRTILACAEVVRMCEARKGER